MAQSRRLAAAFLSLYTVSDQDPDLVKVTGYTLPELYCESLRRWLMKQFSKKNIDGVLLLEVKFSAGARARDVTSGSSQDG